MKNLSKLMTGVSLAAMTMPAVAQQKPNIIFIYADDMGYNDLQCYGSKVNDTPNLDAMAKEGVRFTDFYSCSPVSAPSRACLLTGRFAPRMGIRHVFFAHSFTGMPTSEVTMGQMLKEQGYATAIYGKWHLGVRDQYLPLQRGFDEFFGTYCSVDNPPFVYIDGNTPQTHTANKDSTTQKYMEHAINFIERNKDKPFFCYVPFNMPHVPLAASANFKGKSRNGLYGDVIMEMDWAVGQIIKKVDELGLGENTIICFSSDNGPWLSEGPYGGSAYPLYRGKGTTWDGGQRVPMIVRWKGHIKAGTTEKSVACMADWFPTFAAACNGKVPTDRYMDGYNILPVLLGTGKRANQDFAYISSKAFKDPELQAYRSGDWKLKMPESEVKGNYWQTDVPAHGIVLYNLRTDIGEQHDVAAKHPEIVKRLLAKIDSVKATGAIADEMMFQFEFETDALTSKQRLDNVLEAARKGVKPASENGANILEYYKAQETFQKKHGSIF